MTWIEHILGILAMLFCAGLLTVPFIYAAIVTGSLADEHIWDG